MKKPSICKHIYLSKLSILSNIKISQAWQRKKLLRLSECYLSIIPWWLISVHGVYWYKMIKTRKLFDIYCFSSFYVCVCVKTFYLETRGWTRQYLFGCSPCLSFPSLYVKSQTQRNKYIIWKTCNTKNDTTCHLMGITRLLISIQNDENTNHPIFLYAIILLSLLLLGHFDKKAFLEFFCI